MEAQVVHRLNQLAGQTNNEVNRNVVVWLVLILFLPAIVHPSVNPSPPASHPVAVHKFLGNLRYLFHDQYDFLLPHLLPYLRMCAVHYLHDAIELNGNTLTNTSTTHNILDDLPCLFNDLLPSHILLYLHDKTSTNSSTASSCTSTRKKVRRTPPPARFPFVVNPVFIGVQRGAAEGG